MKRADIERALNLIDSYEDRAAFLFNNDEYERCNIMHAKIDALESMFVILTGDTVEEARKLLKEL